ncbi:hypothetical protein PGO_124840 [Plasmodium gonderi]|uniref:Uncharacterized protein n=1 Tax=Plasmodium gonderi TaxID=77519 RepID=A0A1Y1JJ20_PLAGO|nr:hypothetical protein PGO_124840 [Plasmodium gonderi]GAW82486.1 hypothetical protein PGO_124840 [Plasmodium gonderi]
MEKEKLLYEKFYPAYNAYRFHFSRLCDKKKNIESIIGDKKVKNCHHMIVVSSYFSMKKMSAKDTTQKMRGGDSPQKTNSLCLSGREKRLFVSFIFLWNQKEPNEKTNFLSQLFTTAIIQTFEFYHIKFNIEGTNNMSNGDTKIVGCLVDVHFVKMNSLVTPRICISSFGHNHSVFMVTNISIDSELLRAKNDMINGIHSKESNPESYKKNLVHDINYQDTEETMVENVIDKLIEKFYSVMNTLVTNESSSLLGIGKIKPCTRI